MIDGKNLLPKIFSSMAISKAIRQLPFAVGNCEGCLYDHTIRVQDKGSRFVLLSNEKYCENVQRHIYRSSFTLLSIDFTKLFEGKINTWTEKWITRQAIDENGK